MDVAPRETVGVVIPKFGMTSIWDPIAQRAYGSALCQTMEPYECAVILGKTLAEARNNGAELFKECDWLIFLDADDELDPYYIESMLKGSGDIRWPSTIGVYEDGTEDDAPVLLTPRYGADSLMYHNWMVIGSMVRTSLFFRAGGFREQPILEDWDLWIRCVLKGGKPEPCADAIYRVHVNPNSRNKQGDALHGKLYVEIQERYWPQWRAR